jgi:hypothetical protein
MDTEYTALSYPGEALPARVTTTRGRELVNFVTGALLVAAFSVVGTVLVGFGLLAAVVLSPVLALGAAYVVGRGVRAQRRLTA